MFSKLFWTTVRKKNPAFCFKNCNDLSEQFFRHSRSEQFGKQNTIVHLSFLGKKDVLSFVGFLLYLFLIVCAYLSDHINGMEANTLCSICLCKYYFGLGVTVIIKIKFHPCYPISFGWFSWDEAKKLKQKLRIGGLKKTEFFKFVNFQFSNNFQNLKNANLKTLSAWMWLNLYMVVRLSNKKSFGC